MSYTRHLRWEDKPWYWARGPHPNTKLIIERRKRMEAEEKIVQLEHEIRLRDKEKSQR